MANPNRKREEREWGKGGLIAVVVSFFLVLLSSNRITKSFLSLLAHLRC